MAAVCHSMECKLLSVSADPKDLSDAFEVRGRLKRNHSAISCVLYVNEGAVSSSPVLSKTAQQFKKPELLEQI